MKRGRWRAQARERITQGLCDEAVIDALRYCHGEESVRTCRICGCTDDNCFDCAYISGVPCWWVEEDLCSRCAMEKKLLSPDKMEELRINYFEMGVKFEDGKWGEAE
jgi:hypothetical protein